MLCRCKNYAPRVDPQVCVQPSSPQLLREYTPHLVRPGAPHAIGARPARDSALPLLAHEQLARSLRAMCG